MLRFILTNTFKDPESGGEGVWHYTVDADVPELEKLLKRTRHTQHGYQEHKVIGVEELE